MSWQDKLKEANINIHYVATGGGANFQGELWSEPGSSAYFSGASFPYSPEEQAEFLGFMPEHFCSEGAAVDLASAAYIKAYQFGGKNPVGLALTASVASEKEHRGDHRIYSAIMTNDRMITAHHTLTKGIGARRRSQDNIECDTLAFYTLIDGLNGPKGREYKDATSLATERFFKRPFFTANGKRLQEYDIGYHTALMPGAFNPPHDGHFGTADYMWRDYRYDVVFEITAKPPHKEALTVQQCLQRAKLLQGHDRLFTVADPYYLDKARAHPGVPLVLGADAMLRLLDPKWGKSATPTLQEFNRLGTELFIVGREIDGKFIEVGDITNSLVFPNERSMFERIAHPVRGEWHVSSTEIRNKTI